MSNKKQLEEILQTCEQSGATQRYIYEEGKKSIIEYDARQGNVTVVSDFHAAFGKKRDGSYAGTENFFADDSFARFLDFLHSSQGGKRAVLVINGDFLDFLRVVPVPRVDGAFVHWQAVLAKIGIEKSVEDLRNSITKKERRYGMKTDDYKSVWKLDRIANGHSAMFDALALWLKRGHRLVIVKGNHDLEWFWPAVRNYCRLLFAERIVRGSQQSAETALRKYVFPNLSFVDDAMIVDGELYIEHGQRYDKFTEIVGKALLPNGKELNIPFGSFFNRYLLNRLELVYPYLDNVRPRQNILHILMRERFFFGLKFLWQSVPLTFWEVPWPYWKFMLKPLASYLLAIGIPLLAVLILWGDRLIPIVLSSQSSPPLSSLWDVVRRYLGGFVQDGMLLFLSYAFARFVAKVQLEEPSSLLENAKVLLRENLQYRFVTMGHTHNPEQYEKNGRWYINTSTWIPVVESSSAELREDRTFAVLRFVRDSKGKFGIFPLERWNDDAGRLDPMIIVERKEYS